MDGRIISVELMLLDTSGLLCPMPIIRLQEAVKNAEVGTTITLISTDPGSLEDVPSWCRIHKHQLTAIRNTEFEYTFELVVN